MDFELPEEYRMLRDTVRRFVDRELIPIELESMDGPNLKPEIRTELEKKAKEIGLWMPDVPEEYGGQGLGLLGMTIIWQELARTIALPPRPYRGIFGPEAKPLLYNLNPEQKEKYLFPLLRGEKNTTFAQTEPDAGADPGSMRTTAVRHGDHYIINGNKRFISNAAEADFIQLVAATDRSKGSRGGLSVFLVDTDTLGFKITRKTIKMMGDATYELAFDNMKVPVENMVGPEGQGMSLAQGWLTAGRLLQASRGLGVAQRCIEMGASYAKQRVTFGKPLADRQAIQFMIADTFMEHALGQSYVFQSAAKADQGKLARHESFVTKVFCTELGFRAADRCLQIHGGMGLTKELPIYKMWMDSRSFLITEGPVEVMRATLAREIFRMYG
jgi:acyl-CoA dehydrogenase